MARSSTANRRRWSSSCGSWPAWPKGLGIRATARVFEVAPNTVLQWLVEAAEQLRAFSAYFLCDLHLEQLQLDELYAVLRDRKAGEISDDEAIKRLERSPYWVWTAMDPTEQAAGGGRCRQPHPGDGAARRASGDRGVGARLCAAVSDRWPQGLRHGIADPFWPLDATRTAPGQRPHAQAAVDAAARAALRASGEVVPAPAHRGGQAPRGVRHPAGHRAGLGEHVAGPSTPPLSSGSTSTSASAWRRSGAGSTRCARAKRACGISWRCSRSITTSSCPTRVCASALPIPMPTNGRGSAKVWRPCTPAMAAGLTDHVWSLKEVLCYRVPPWPQPQTV